MSKSKQNPASDIPYTDNIRYRDAENHWYGPMCLKPGDKYGENGINDFSAVLGYLKYTQN